MPDQVVGVPTPRAGAISGVAWELRDGSYVRVADVGGDQAFVTDRPFPVTIRPSTLVD